MRKVSVVSVRQKAAFSYTSVKGLPSDGPERLLKPSPLFHFCLSQRDRGPADTRVIKETAICNLMFFILY